MYIYPYHYLFMDYYIIPLAVIHEKLRIFKSNIIKAEIWSNLKRLFIKGQLV